MKYITWFILVFIAIFAVSNSTQTTVDEVNSNRILLENHQNVAIATDLEPDDVLALYILFKEANQQYAATGEYPIKLIIVGEGNVDIKKKRMEALLEYMNAPKDIKVVKGKSTSDNIFPLDGEELFDKNQLKDLPFKDNPGAEGVHAISEFLTDSDNPLIIQIKPAQELLSIPSDLAKKATIIFYGSFNFRKTIKDEQFLKNENFNNLSTSNDTEKLQALLDYFRDHFKLIGILESYGILGEQSSVYSGYPWTDEIRNQIENSNDNFLIMFQKLVHNWNSYLLFAELPEIRTHLLEIIAINGQPELKNSLAKLDQIIKNWDEKIFLEIYDETTTVMQQMRKMNPNAELITLIDKFERGMKFANQLKPSSGVQFTLSDVGVALALSDKIDFFKSSQAKISINKYGFIEALKNPGSNILYYDRVDRDKFAQILIETLNQ